MKTIASDKWFPLRAAFVFLLLASLYFSGPESASSVGLSIVIVFALMYYLRVRHPDRYKKDERTNRIGAYAASYSWFVTYLAVAILYLLDYTGYLRVPASVAISTIFALMAVTIIAFRWHLSLKGDVQ
jgi:hypothetical protein